MIFAIVIIAVLALLFHKTFFGIYQLRMARWDEERFVGKSLPTLQGYLNDRSVKLEPVQRDTFYGRVRRDLSHNQRVYRFLKGSPYRWWLLVGTVQNAGLVVTEFTPQGEVIVELLKVKYIDSL